MGVCEAVVEASGFVYRGMDARSCPVCISGYACQEYLGMVMWKVLKLAWGVCSCKAETNVFSSHTGRSLGRKSCAAEFILLSAWGAKRWPNLWHVVRTVPSVATGSTVNVSLLRGGLLPVIGPQAPFTHDAQAAFHTKLRAYTTGPIHTRRENANFQAIPLVLLASSVDTPIHNRFHLLAFCICAVDGPFVFLVFCVNTPT